MGLVLGLVLNGLAPRPAAALARQADPRGLTEAWRIDTEGAATTPLVADDRVVLASGRAVVSLDGSRGDVRWTRDLDAEAAFGPVAVGDALLVVDEAGTLTALLADHGRPVWSVALPGGAAAPPVLAGGSVVVAVTGDEPAADAAVADDVAGGALVAFDPATGDERWQADLGGGADGTLAVLGDAVAAGVTDPGTGDPVVAVFDAADGRERWRTDPAVPLLLAGAGADHLYAVSDTDGVLIAVDGEGGERWRLEPGDGLAWNAAAVAEADGVLYAAAEPASRRGSRTADPVVRAIGAATGEVRWTSPLPGLLAVSAGPIVADDAVAVLVGGPPTPVLLDRGTGRIGGRAEWPVGGAPRAIAAGDGVLVATGDDRAIAFRLDRRAGGPATPAATRPAGRPNATAAPTTAPRPTTTATPRPTKTATPQPTATPTPTAVPATGSVTVRAFACPVAYAGADYAADCAEPLADIDFRLFIPQSDFSRDGTTDPSGATAFRGLGPATYALAGGVPAEFATQALRCAAGGTPLPVEPLGSEVPGGSFRLAAGAAVACAWYVIPVDLRGDTPATIAVTVHLCAAVPADPYAECIFGDASGAVLEGPVRLATDASSDVPVRVHGVSWVWGEETGLPLGTYFLQTQGIVVPPGYGLAEVRGSLGGTEIGWSVPLDGADPNALLAVVYLPLAGEDRDGDGLSSDLEVVYGTDIDNPDSDGDALLDGIEVALGGPGTNPLDADTDRDGYTDNAELELGTNPTDPTSVPDAAPAPDADGDGLPDADEAALGTDPFAADTDGDGLSDLAEAGGASGPGVGSDPTAFDTDGDGTGDGAEVAADADPLDPTR